MNLCGSLFFEEVNPSARQFPKSWKDCKLREIINQETKSVKCPICEQIFDSLIDIQKFEADHIVPYSSGGKTVWDNLQVICRKCNRKKSNDQI